MFNKNAYKISFWIFLDLLYHFSWKDFEKIFFVKWKEWNILKRKKNHFTKQFEKSFLRSSILDANSIIKQTKKKEFSHYKIN